MRYEAAPINPYKTVATIEGFEEGYVFADLAFTPFSLITGRRVREQLAMAQKNEEWPQIVTVRNRIIYNIPHRIVHGFGASYKSPDHPLHEAYIEVGTKAIEFMVSVSKGEA